MADTNDTSDNDKNDQINDIDKNATEAGVDTSDKDEPGENDKTSNNEDEAINKENEDEKSIKEKPSDDIKVPYSIIYFLNVIFEIYSLCTLLIFNDFILFENDSLTLLRTGWGGGLFSSPLPYFLKLL